MNDSAIQPKLARVKAMRKRTDPKTVASQSPSPSRDTDAEKGPPQEGDGDWQEPTDGQAPPPITAPQYDERTGSTPAAKTSADCLNDAAGLPKSDA